MWADLHGGTVLINTSLYTFFSKWNASLPVGLDTYVDFGLVVLLNARLKNA